MTRGAAASGVAVRLHALLRPSLAARPAAGARASAAPRLARRTKVRARLERMSMPLREEPSARVIANLASTRRNRVRHRAGHGLRAAGGFAYGHRPWTRSSAG